MKEIYEKMDLPTLLEIIEHNLCININSFHNQIAEMLGNDSSHKDRIKKYNFLKRDLKKQIKEYLKIVVRNIANLIETHPDIEGSDVEIIQYLRKAIK